MIKAYIYICFRNVIQMHYTSDLLLWLLFKVVSVVFPYKDNSQLLSLLKVTPAACFSVSLPDEEVY